MDRSSVITLIARSYQADAIGQQVPVETKRDVYCNLSSASASEWFAGGQIGLKPEYRATMFAYDYQQEQEAEIDGTRYSVYRTYRGKNETVELYLERKAGTA